MQGNCEVKTDAASTADDKAVAMAGWVADLELVAAFNEATVNGDGISWRYWVHQMPKLTASQAARLMCGLDPDTFENLANRPNKDHDPSRLCDKAMKIQRMAETEGILEGAPNDWLHWANGKHFQLDANFVSEVGATAGAAPLASELTSKPKTPVVPFVQSTEVSSITHKIQNRTQEMSVEIDLAKKQAINPSDAKSVWAELTKLAKGGNGAMIGYSSDGIQFRGRKFQASEVPDVLTFKNLRDRMTRDKKRLAAPRRA